MREGRSDPPAPRRASGRLASVLLAALCALGAGCARERPGTPPRNLLLISFEGVRADHCSPWQYPRPTTIVEVDDEQPRAHDLDLIAESGVVFARAFAPSGSPLDSLVALHTGRAPPPGSSAPALPTLAERLAGAGFDTAAFVMPSIPIAGSGLERGFGSFGEHAQPLNLMRSAAAWLYQGRDEDRPHFLWLHIGEAAWPWEWEPLPGRGGQLDFARLFADPDARELRTDLEFLRALQRGEVQLSHAERDALVAAYDGQIARANLLMREFLEYYKHIWADTLVVVAGVNGMELGERGHWGSEGSLHDGGLHVPLVLRHPGSLTGRRILAEVVELADAAPTVLDWFGLDASDAITGRSLLPLVDSYVRRRFESRPALARRGGGESTARDGRWRLLLNPAGVPPEAGMHPVREVELYDLLADPRALRDVAPLYPEVVESLRSALERSGAP